MPQVCSYPLALPQGVVDLTALLGTYAAIGSLLNVAEVGFEAPSSDKPELLPFTRS
jgi:hypothetical protein